MKHHFTISERLAILVYRILREGGLLEYDYTDMVSSPIKSLHTNAEGVTPINRTIIFTCDSPIIQGERCVEISLLGQEDGCGFRSWRLLDVLKVFGHGSPESGFKQRVDLPTSGEQAGREVIQAQVGLKKCEAKKKLFNLMATSYFAPEVEKE